MATPKHVNIVKLGADAIQAWRIKHRDAHLDLADANLRNANLNRANLHQANLSEANLSGANLSEANLSGANLSEANLSDANLREANLNRANLSNTDLIFAKLIWADLRVADLTGANLFEADLTGANLVDADLTGTNLVNADLSGADLSGTDLTTANLSDANLSGADLCGAFLYEANLSQATLNDANFENARLFRTIFADVDLSAVRGLASVKHSGPSEIGVSTLYRLQGQIPEDFLRGCGVPDALIAMIPSLIGAMEPIQYQSCFISYSTKNEDFARRLYSRMRDEKLRVWFAPEDLKRGEKLHEQIDRAIQVNDRLLVVLSRHSMKSDWVKAEIIKARKTERAENRRKLFPIALVPFGEIQKWQCFDPHTGEDLAAEIRQYFLPDDFSNWKDHDAFETAFTALLRDLRAEAQRDKP